MLSKNKKSKTKLVSLPTTAPSNVVRLRPMGTPAHLRTDFNPTDADIKTLVGNVLSGRNRLREVRLLVEDLMLSKAISMSDGEKLLAIINRPESQ